MSSARTGLAALAVAGLLAGCGQSNADHEAVRTAVRQTTQAIERKDATALCDHLDKASRQALPAAILLGKPTRQAQKMRLPSCQQGAQRYLEALDKEPNGPADWARRNSSGIKKGKVQSRGDRATLTVPGNPPKHVLLVREQGRWLVRLGR